MSVRISKKSLLYRLISHWGDMKSPGSMQEVFEGVLKGLIHILLVITSTSAVVTSTVLVCIQIWLFHEPVSIVDHPKGVITFAEIAECLQWVIGFVTIVVLIVIGLVYAYEYAYRAGHKIIDLKNWVMRLIFKNNRAVVLDD